tara:strand:+ start:5099 stop:5593 length:495 start_codon:yes stop_codon:yes gene_type:complete
MPTLYELSADLQFLLDLADQEGGDESIEQALDEIQGQISEKAESIGKIVRELEITAEGRRKEADRLVHRANVAEKAAKRALDYLEQNMRLIGMKTLETKSFKYTRAKNGGKQPIEINEDIVPDDYKVEKVQTKINRERIRKEMESGNKLPFAQFQERGERFIMN